MEKEREGLSNKLVEAKKEYSRLIVQIEDLYKKNSISRDDDELFYEGIYKAKQFEEVLEYVVRKQDFKEYDE